MIFRCSSLISCGFSACLYEFYIVCGLWVYHSSHHWLFLLIRVTSTSGLMKRQVKLNPQTLSWSSLRLSQRRRNLTMAILDSRYTSCLPMQLLGPPLKFIWTICCMLADLQRSSFHRSGLNSRGSSKYSSLKWGTFMLMFMRVPFSTGMSPRFMFCEAYRSTNSSDGDLSRRASSNTKCKYSIFLKVCPLMSSSHLMCSLISALSLRRTSGRLKISNMKATKKLEVFSSPAIRKRQISQAMVCSTSFCPSMSCTTFSMMLADLQLGSLSRFSLSSCMTFLTYFLSTFIPSFLRCRNRLESAVSLRQTALQPSKMKRGVQVSFMERLCSSLRAMLRGRPSIFSSLESICRKKDIMTLPNMLSAICCKFSRSFPSPHGLPLALASSSSNFLSQSCRMTGAMSMRALQLKKLERTLLRCFHQLFSINSTLVLQSWQNSWQTPLYLGASMTPSMLTSCCMRSGLSKWRWVQVPKLERRMSYLGISVRMLYRTSL